MSLDSITASTGVSSDTIDLSDVSTLVPAVLGRTVTIPLGTVTNSNSNGASETITLRYTAPVTNVSTNQGEGTGSMLNNTVRLDWEVDGAVQQSTPASSPFVEVIEPTLTVSKAVSLATADAGDTLVYTMVIQHATSSDMPAYDVDFSDVLPAELTFLSLTAIHSTGGDMSTNFAYAAGTVATTVTGDFDLQIGELVTLTVTGRLDNTVVPNQSLQNQAAATYTTIDGDDANERTGDDGTGGSPNESCCYFGNCRNDR